MMTDLESAGDIVRVWEEHELDSIGLMMLQGAKPWQVAEAFDCEIEDARVAIAQCRTMWEERVRATVDAGLVQTIATLEASAAILWERWRDSNKATKTKDGKLVPAKRDHKALRDAMDVEVQLVDLRERLEGRLSRWVIRGGGWSASHSDRFITECLDSARAAQSLPDKVSTESTVAGEGEGEVPEGDGEPAEGGKLQGAEPEGEGETAEGDGEPAEQSAAPRLTPSTEPQTGTTSDVAVPRELSTQVVARAYRLQFESFAEVPWMQDYWLLRQEGWDWRKSAYIAWASSPIRGRWPETQQQLATEVLGLKSDQMIPRWKKQDSAIDDAIGAWQAIPLMRYRRDVTEALAAVASRHDSSGAGDRRTFLKMTKDLDSDMDVTLTGALALPTAQMSDEELDAVITNLLLAEDHEGSVGAKADLPPDPEAEPKTAEPAACDEQGAGKSRDPGSDQKDDAAALGDPIPF